MLIEKYNKKINKYLSKSLTKLYDKPLLPPTKEENLLVEELRSDFKKLPVLESDNCNDSQKRWINNANTLRELILSKDPRDFLRWHVISSAMFVKYAGYIGPEYKILKKLPDWDSRWKEAVQETHIGHPLPYYLYPKSSANLIHHAYHIAVLEQSTKINLQDVDFVFEFGGGYGSMCRLFNNLGFSGRYVIFDMPAFSALQKYFLKSIGISVSEYENFQDMKEGAVCLSEMQELKNILSTNDISKNSLFIGTWSISETPYALRDEILPLISNFNTFLIAYQQKFHEADNIKFFKEWISTYEDIKWDHYEIKHMPGNWYLIGRRKIK